MAATAAIALVGCGPSAPTDTDPKTITISGWTDLSFNPFEAPVNWLGGPLADGVYDSLTVLDLNTTEVEIKPSVATEWEISADRRTIDWTIRDDVNFSDGTHLDAAGVVTILSTMRDRDVFGPAWDSFTFAATGEYTFRSEAAANLGATGDIFLTSLASPEAIESESLDEVPVGSGPYLLEEGGTRGVERTLIKNPDHWNADAYPYDKIIVKTFEDRVAALNALLSGQIDAAPIDVAAAAEAESAGMVLHPGGGRVWALYFGDRAGEIVPAIGDVRVRQAINMAFDREAISETIELGYGRSTSQVYIEGQMYHQEGRDDEYPYDPDAARELLAEAGYPDGFDLPLPSIPGFASVEPILQQSLADIGIRVTFDVYAEFSDFLGAINAKKYAATIWTENINWTLLLKSGYLISDAWPLDPRMTELIAFIESRYVAPSTIDSETAAAGQEVGELLLEEAWFAPFTRKIEVWASIPEVKIIHHPLAAWTTIESYQLAGD